MTLGDGRDKPVATAGNGFNKPWVVGIIINGCPQFLQNGIQTAIKVDISALRPKPLPQFVTGNNFARTFQENKEHAKRLVLNFDAHAATGQIVARNVGLE